MVVLLQARVYELLEALNQQDHFNRFRNKPMFVSLPRVETENHRILTNHSQPGVGSTPTWLFFALPVKNILSSPRLQRLC